jgi:hypothetical protein
MTLTDFLKRELAFEECVYMSYKSETHFDARLYPYTEIPIDSIFCKIKEFYKSPECEQIEDTLFFRNHTPPITVRVEEFDMGEDYFFDLKIRNLEECKQ